MLKEIGSNFWLPQGEKNRTEIDKLVFNAAFDDFVYTASGRSAISLILSELTVREKRVLLPSFTCESVIEPFSNQEYIIDCYSVNEGLNIEKKRFLENIKASKPTVLLIHNYFGFNTTYEIKGIVDNLRTQGVVVIEDITQTLYSSYPRLSADYYVGSFRKWDGIPDGGFALKAKGAFKKKPENEDIDLVEAKVNAMKAKYNYMFHNIGEKVSFLNMYAEAEEILEHQTEIYRMSDTSNREQANLDIKRLKEKRRRNFKYLLQNLNSHRIEPLFPNISDDVVPLYFPILCGGKRSSLQSWLRTNQVFAPIVWPKPELMRQVEGKADYFYKNLLCIPIDQRYDLDDIERLVDIFKSWESEGIN